MIYIESTAAVKLVHNEVESAALNLWLTERLGQPRITSALTEVEVSRAIRRGAPDALYRVASVLATLYRIEIDAVVRATAASLAEPMLRSLDAIHLATALQLGAELQTFVTYDKRLRTAAEVGGLCVVSPGILPS